MDIKDYAQMMGYLTRPRDVVPDPSTMDQEPQRTGFSNGGSYDYGSMQYKIDSVNAAYRRYKKGSLTGGRKGKMTFEQFAPIWAKENFADGGRIGFSKGKVVKQLLKKIESPTRSGPGRPFNQEELQVREQFINAFNEYKEKVHDGVFKKAAEALGESREKIKGIFDRVRFFKTGTRAGADVGATKMRTTIQTPDDIIPYIEATTLVKKDKNFLKNKIKNFDKNKFYSPKDIANILGVDSSNKSKLDRLVADLKRFKVDSKERTGQQNFFKLNDAVNKITKGYEKKLVKGDKQATTKRLEIESRLDPELTTFYNKFKDQVRKISKEEDLFVPNAVEDLGHTLSIKITDKYPQLIKNSNINKINTLTFQDPILNKEILLKSGYENNFDNLFARLNKLVDKKVGNAELQELQSIKNEMNNLYLKVINDTKTLAKQNKYFIGQEKRIPKIDINIPEQGQTFKSKNLFADMSKVNPAFKVGMVEDINPNAKFFNDLTKTQKEIYKKNILNQTQFNLGKFYSKVGAPKEQINELKDSLEIGTFGKLGIGVTGSLVATQASAADGTEATGFTTGEKAAAGTAAGTVGTKKGRNILGKTFRTLGTRAAAVPLAGYTIYDNLKKGENVVDATLDPLVGAELMLPNLFKENVAKITKNPTLQKILKVGKYGRMFTPVGAGITAAGLGIDAYKYGKKRIAELQAMSPEERAELAQKRDDFSFGEYSGAAEGGLASLNVKK